MSDFSLWSFFLGALAWFLIDVASLQAFLWVLRRKGALYFWRRDRSLVCSVHWFKRRSRGPVVQPGASFDEPTASARPSEPGSL